MHPVVLIFINVFLRNRLSIFLTFAMLGVYRVLILCCVALLLFETCICGIEAKFSFGRFGNQPSVIKPVYKPPWSKPMYQSPPWSKPTYQSPPWSKPMYQPPPPRPPVYHPPPFGFNRPPLNPLTPIISYASIPKPLMPTPFYTPDAKPSMPGYVYPSSPKPLMPIHVYPPSPKPLTPVHFYPPSPKPFMLKHIYPPSFKPVGQLPKHPSRQHQVYPAISKPNFQKPY